MCWFRASVTVHIARMHEMRCVVEQGGLCLEVLRERRPGDVVYEDEYQVVEEPFADLRS